MASLDSGKLAEDAGIRVMVNELGLVSLGWMLTFSDSAELLLLLLLCRDRTDRCFSLSLAANRRASGDVAVSFPFDPSGPRRVCSLRFSNGLYERVLPGDTGCCFVSLTSCADRLAETLSILGDPFTGVRLSFCTFSDITAVSGSPLMGLCSVGSVSCKFCISCSSWTPVPLPRTGLAGGTRS